KYFSVPTSTWTAFNGSTLAVLGLRFVNPSADFKMLIGEMSVKKAGETSTPTTPTILRSSLKQVSYKGFDFKLSWNCGANVGVDGYTPTYNADRNVWYFELWGQQEGFEPTLVSATTSWAGYGVNVPFDKNAASQRVRYGVRAVSIDGVTKSDIVWTSYEDTSSKKIISNDIEIDKPVIKANEDFTIKFSDPENAGAKSWVLKNSKNVTVATFNNAREITHSLPNVDIYNLIITFNDNSTATYNGYVVISGEEVGAMPRLDSYKFDNSDIEQAEIDIDEVQHTFSYTGRDADGTSSKAVTIMDNMPLAIEGGYFPRNTPVSFCAWIKITKIDESRENENQFLTLRTRNAYDSNGGSWADAYYLDSWRIMIVNPDNNIDYKLKFQFDTGNITVMDNYILPFNAWFHLAVCADANRTFDVYVNGEKKINQAVGKGNYATNGRSDFRFYASGGSVCGWNGWGGAMDDVQVWHKVLSQSEVKEAMNGYPEGATIPTDLKGYWDFESIIGEEPEEGEGEGEDEGESEPETVAPLLTTYCSTMGKPSDGGTDRGVSNIQLNGNTVSINEYSSSSRDAYRGTKNNESSAISLAKGSSYSLRVNGSLNWTYITCFADWNADGDFSDANERIGTNPNGVHSPFTSGSANASYRDFTINVPADAASAYIPLRLKMSYCTNNGETAMGTADPCSLTLYKETINQAVAVDVVLKVATTADSGSGSGSSSANISPEGNHAIYNDEVDTWYFEIWSQQKDSLPVLITATTSWAGYAINAPYDVTVAGNEFRYGVRSVAPDGVTKSEIAWTEWETIEDNEITELHDIICDKPVIKVNEDFTVSFKDPTHGAAASWVLKSAATDATVATFNGGTSFTHSLGTTGSYDLIVTLQDRTQINLPGFIQISIPEVGAVPKVFSIETTNEAREEDGGNRVYFDLLSTDVTAEYRYTGGRAADAVAGTSADGSVSQGVNLEETSPIAIDGKFIPYNKPITIAFWMKIRETQGDQTQFFALTTRNNSASCTGCWAFGNYGAMWSTMNNKTGIMSVSWRKSTEGGTTMNAGAVSTESGKGAKVGSWVHLALTFEPGGYASSNARAGEFFFNGNASGSTTNPNNGGTGAIVDKGQDGFKSHRLYIGGNANDGRAGLIATVDDIQIWHKKLSAAEVLDAMQGYSHRLDQIPNELVGYWSLDEYDEETMTFPNQGKGTWSDINDYVGSSSSSYG
ncbi:MAG: hypothetical protein J6P95_05665, partial [Paludibacteraceae bacterium]|nr:hypothetical protein [Paludibacteraceae bacterium]